MALPPEQINIKRRREEEPVETLYIQSELHQTKRRFTDFVFQRVQIRGNSSGSSNDAASPGPAGSGPGNGPSPRPGGVPEPTRQRVLRTPRSVSSLIVAKSGNRTGPGGPGGSSGSSALGPGSGVPLVRATSPGAEIREERRLAAQRKEKEERIRKAVYESPSPSPSSSSSKPVPAPVPAPSPSLSPVATRESRESSDRSSPTVSSSPGKPIRRFQISRTSANTPMNLHRSFDGGVQKRKGTGGADGVAVLVEKLRRKTHSRQASVALQGVTGVNLDGAAPGTTGDAAGSGTDEPRPRKRPVVNQAERKWREERKNAISAAKDNIRSAMDRGAQARHKDSNWDDESDKLVGEFERIALELDGPSLAQQTQTQTQPQTEVQTEAQTESKPPPSKPLKYQPRTPSKPRNDPATATKPERTEESQDTEDSEDDYVYDVYVRRPLTQAQAHAESQSQSLLQPPSQPQFQSQSLPTNLKNPLAELENQNALLSANVGVIVITQEDEIYWENFIEDEDDDDWDSEDADSNAENNPANDYPDEELSWDGSDEDVFMRYRQVGFDDYGSGSEDGYGYDYDSDY